MIARRLTTGLLVVGTLVAGTFASGCGEDSDYVVRAQIGDAEGIEKNFVVRIDGAEVGNVSDIDVNRDDVAVIEMKVDDDAAPIGAGARLSARAANLLGEKYLDLDAGDRSRPMDSGTLIPLNRTRSEVQLDDIFNTLDPTTRAQMRILINEAGIGLAGRGTDLNNVISQMPGTLRETEQVLDQLTTENRDLGKLIVAAEQTVTPSARRRGDVSNFVRSVRLLMQTTSERRERLAETLQAAPSSLRQLQTSLAGLQETSRNLRPAAALLRRAAPSAAAVLSRLPDFASSAEGTLDTARDVAPELARLGRRGAPDVRRLSRTLERTADFSAAAAPVLESAGRGKVVAGLLNVMQNWTRSINSSDSLGHYFRLRLVIAPDAAKSLISQLTPQSKSTSTATRRDPQPGAKPAVPLPEIRLPQLSEMPTLTSRLPRLPSVAGLAKPVRDLVVEVLNRVGLTPTIQSLVSTIQERGRATAAEVDRLKGLLKNAPQATPPTASNPPATSGNTVKGLLDFLLK